MSAAVAPLPMRIQKLKQNVKIEIPGNRIKILIFSESAKFAESVPSF